MPVLQVDPRDRRLARQHDAVPAYWTLTSTTVVIVLRRSDLLPPRGQSNRSGVVGGQSITSSYIYSWNRRLENVPLETLGLEPEDLGEAPGLVQILAGSVRSRRVNAALASAEDE